MQNEKCSNYKDVDSKGSNIFSIYVKKNSSAEILVTELTIYF